MPPARRPRSPKSAPETASDQPAVLHLTRFLPYRLSVLANTVSHTVAKLYEKRFGITIPEWRIIAVLGGGETLSAGEIAQRTAMDKVQVSRAISRMLDSELILRESGDTDRRKALLTLTPKALAIYAEIVPMALAYEAKLTDALPEEEHALLDRLIARLQARADQLAAAPPATAELEPAED
ncbi:MarR family winged helix-turn-helix transcriptional regulator [Azospirillum doebereinerae]|uniref:MarR family transcriptional regulator n=1 Tax=Azospirillum doebereinerae TaxID=92933 RepID=A0A3S0V7Y3_9PROT|nr:MarR family winged helix-turn-helix transcriptional regulator [Azospirillum doebereinerae]MCG5242043.1 MarR family winged helix-turn-helix transcriptional regulator [Azospirillum doebereinerae]RUQ74249.1 MarR family transcriptional regulator [Azospirillum doebereinerae]